MLIPGLSQDKIQNCRRIYTPRPLFRALTGRLIISGSSGKSKEPTHKLPMLKPHEAQPWTLDMQDEDGLYLILSKRQTAARS